MKTLKLTTAQALIRFLKNQFVLRDEVEHRLIQGIFGIFGHGNVTGIGQALEEDYRADPKAALPFYQPKNEQSMVHTAIAFSKTNRGLGTFGCTTSIGPGATNLVTGAATATINRLPVLLLPGDVFSNRKPDPVLQQLEWTPSKDFSVNDCLKPVSRYWDRIHRPEQLLSALPMVSKYLAYPELYGAVTLALPQDVQTESYDFPISFFEKRVYTIQRRKCTEEELESLAQAIKKSKRPFIIAGGGVYYSQAGTILKEFCEKTGIPFGVTQAGTSSTPPSSCNLGGIGVTGTQSCNQIATQADLILAIGTRLSDFTTASHTQFNHSEFFSINLSLFDAHKLGGKPILGDAKAVLMQLTEKLSTYQVLKNYQSEIKMLQSQWDATYQNLTQDKPKLTQARIIVCLNEFIDSQSTIVHAAGGLPGDLHKLWRTKSQGDYHSEYGYSCMGYEIAGALGVKLADPRREVYAVLGDGSYLMLNHEIVTSLQEDKKITVILLDNGGYQCIHNLQKGHGSLGFGNEFRKKIDGELKGSFVKVDFMANAKSLGAKVYEVKTLEDFRSALQASKKETQTTLIYVSLQAEEQAEEVESLPGFSWWDVPVAETSQMQTVREAYQEYEQKKKSQKFYY